MGALVAGAWSLRDRYPRIDVSVTGLEKQVQASRAQPVVSKPEVHIVVKEPPRKPRTLLWAWANARRMPARS